MTTIRVRLFNPNTDKIGIFAAVNDVGSIKSSLESGIKTLLSTGLSFGIYKSEDLPRIRAIVFEVVKH